MANIPIGKILLSREAKRRALKRELQKKNQQKLFQANIAQASITSNRARAMSAGSTFSCGETIQADSGIYACSACTGGSWDQVQLTASGISNSACSDCDEWNGSFLLDEGNLSSFGACGWALMFNDPTDVVCTPAGAYGNFWTAQIYPGFGASPHTIRVAAYSAIPSGTVFGGTTQIHLVFSLSVPQTDICAGSYTVPLITEGTESGECDGTSATVTVDFGGTYTTGGSGGSLYDFLSSCCNCCGDGGDGGEEDECSETKCFSSTATADACDDCSVGDAPDYVYVGIRGIVDDSCESCDTYNGIYKCVAISSCQYQSCALTDPCDGATDYAVGLTVGADTLYVNIITDVDEVGEAFSTWQSPEVLVDCTDGYYDNLEEAWTEEFNETDCDVSGIEFFVDFGGNCEFCEDTLGDTGSSCANCSDTTPAAFVLGTGFTNEDCDECEYFNGMVFVQDSGDSCNYIFEAIDTDCCSAVPLEITATFSVTDVDTGGCDGVDGGVVTLTYDSGDSKWKGTNTIDGIEVIIHLFCTGGGTWDWDQWCDGNAVITGSFDSTSCDPFELVTTDHGDNFCCSGDDLAQWAITFTGASAGNACTSGGTSNILINATSIEANLAIKDGGSFGYIVYESDTINPCNDVHNLVLSSAVNDTECGYPEILTITAQNFVPRDVRCDGPTGVADVCTDEEMCGESYAFDTASGESMSLLRNDSFDWTGWYSNSDYIWTGDIDYPIDGSGAEDLRLLVVLGYEILLDRFNFVAYLYETGESSPTSNYYDVTDAQTNDCDDTSFPFYWAPGGFEVGEYILISCENVQTVCETEEVCLGPAAYFNGGDGNGLSVPLLRDDSYDISSWGSGAGSDYIWVGDEAWPAAGSGGEDLRVLVVFAYDEEGGANDQFRFYSVLYEVGEADPLGTFYEATDSQSVDCNDVSFSPFNWVVNGYDGETILVSCTVVGSCVNCSDDHTPSTISITISGATNNSCAECVDINGTYYGTQVVDATPCNWYAYLGNYCGSDYWWSIGLASTFSVATLIKDANPTSSGEGSYTAVGSWLYTGGVGTCCGSYEFPYNTTFSSDCVLSSSTVTINFGYCPLEATYCDSLLMLDSLDDGTCDCAYTGGTNADIDCEISNYPYRLNYGPYVNVGTDCINQWSAVWQDGVVTVTFDVGGEQAVYTAAVTAAQMATVSYVMTLTKQSGSDGNCTWPATLECGVDSVSSPC